MRREGGEGAFFLFFFFAGTGVLPHVFAKAIPPLSQACGTHFTLMPVVYLRVEK